MTFVLAGPKIHVVAPRRAPRATGAVGGTRRSCTGQWVGSEPSSVPPASSPDSAPVSPSRGTLSSRADRLDGQPAGRSLASEASWVRSTGLGLAFMIGPLRANRPTEASVTGPCYPLAGPRATFRRSENTRSGDATDATRQRAFPAKGARITVAESIRAWYMDYQDGFSAVEGPVGQRSIPTTGTRASRGTVRAQGNSDRSKAPSPRVARL